MRAIPNMTVVAPSDPVMTAKVVDLLADFEGPVYVRLGRQPAPTLYPADLQLELGKTITVGEGSDVTLIAIGNLVCRALDAAKILADEGVTARVLDMHTVKPIDVAAIVKAAEETGCVVTAEDHNVLGGLGGAVAEVLGSEMPVPLIRIGVQDTFAESGDPDELLEFYGLTAEHIADAARQAMKRRDR